MLKFNKNEDLDSVGIDYLLDKIYKKDISSLYKFEKKRLDNFSDENFDYKSNLIENINNFVETHGSISLNDLRDDIILIYRIDNDERHEISTLLNEKFRCDIYIPSDEHDLEYVLQDYYQKYSDLSIKILEDINMLLEDKFN